MSHDQVGGTPNSQEKSEIDLVELKGRVPLALRRRVKGMSGETGRTMAEVMTELLTKALTPELSDEVVLDKLLRRRWSTALYSALDAERKSLRLSWSEVIQKLAEQHRNDAAGLPAMAPPRPAARDGFIPGTQVVAATTDSTSEADSGIHTSPPKRHPVTTSKSVWAACIRRTPR